MCGLGLGFWVEEIGVMGHAVGPEFKAQMGLGTLVPYRNYKNREKKKKRKGAHNFLSERPLLSRIL